MTDHTKPAPRSGAEGPRVFTDSHAVTWVVREIANPSIPPKLLHFLGGDRRGGGWLVFESAAGEKRRLSPYPRDWETMPDAALEQCCARAQRVPPGPARRQGDRDPQDDAER